MEMCWEAWQKGQVGKGKNTQNYDKCYSKGADEEQYYTDEVNKGMGRIEGSFATNNQGCEMKECQAQASWTARFAPEPEQPRHDQVAAKRAELRHKLSTAARAWSFEQAMWDANVAYNDWLYWCIFAVTSDLLQRP
eukprot:2255265-Pyramimonas_sp.AAC.1